MELEKLYKKGNIARAEDGSLLLVNDDKVAYSVNEVVIMIWDVCNGISFKELVDVIASSSGEDTAQLKPALEGLINEMVEAKLIEIR
ncbi:hypothetical protein HRbin04_01301 [archaeon HR04]|nr:hypothetical protein HRbin04_01301 [archaeon HR04]